MVGKDSAICETLRYVNPLDKWLSNGHEKIGANEIKTKIKILLREEALALGLWQTDSVALIKGRH